MRLAEYGDDDDDDDDDDDEDDGDSDDDDDHSGGYKYDEGKWEDMTLVVMAMGAKIAK